MKRSIRAETDKFRRELDWYRAKSAGFSDANRETSFLEKQISFWMESARFLIGELDIYDQLGDTTNCGVVVKKTQNTLDRLNQVIIRLGEERHGDFKADEEE